MVCERVTVIGLIECRGTGVYVGDMPIAGGGVGVLEERLWLLIKNGL